MKIYQDNVKKYEAEIIRLDNSLRRLSTLRLVVFLSSAIILVFLANERLMASMLIMAPLCAFAFSVLVRQYNYVDNLKRHTTFLKEINEREILRLENKLSDFPTGQTYVNGEHPYGSDLDIFGQHSVFQLINRTTTDLGQGLLAEWLSSSADADIISGRQKATSELSQRLKWRQEFQARGMHFKHTKLDYEHLLNTVQKPAELLPRLKKYLSISVVMSLLSTSALLYFLSNLFSLLSGNAIRNQESFSEAVFMSLVPLIITLLVNTLILRTVRPIAREMTEKLPDHIKILACYESLITSITSDKFQSEKLQILQSTLCDANFSAENEIKKLRRILAMFQLRGRKGEFNNFFYSFFNVLWFLDVYMIILTEKWKNRSGSYLSVWASCVSQFEVINSLAGFHYSNPAFTFPDIKEDSYRIHFEMLGHPPDQLRKKSVQRL